MANVLGKARTKTASNNSRTVQIDLATGIYKVKTIDKGEKEL